MPARGLGAGPPHCDDFHEFVRKVLAQWADPDGTGMHRTATHDYQIVLEGTVGLELDDCVEATPLPDDRTPCAT